MTEVVLKPPLRHMTILQKSSLASLQLLVLAQVALGILQRIGFKEVVCAADGVNALSEMTVRGGGDAFDIVLTDLHMPRKVCLHSCFY